MNLVAGFLFSAFGVGGLQLLGEAFERAKLLGKYKPADLDGFVYDAGRTVGAANGKITTKIKIHVGRDGKNLHAFPWP